MNMKNLLIILLIFSFAFGKPVALKIPKPKRCEFVERDYCDPWRGFFCQEFCMMNCPSFTAKGVCTKDRVCHCHCCE
ncbi:unnamed protein product [Lathyrus oleraceus]